MTKKHFEAIAAILSEVRNDYRHHRHTMVCHEVNAMAVRMADYFKSENKNFDRDRFLTACGL